MKEIKYKDRSLSCDDIDYDLLKDLSIYKHKNGVLYTWINKKNTAIARFMLNLPKSVPIVGYKDGDKSNLQRNNLLLKSKLTCTFSKVDEVYHVYLSSGETILCDSLDIFKNCTPSIHKNFVRIKTYPDDKNRTVAREILGLNENDRNLVVVYKDGNKLNLCKDNLCAIKQSVNIRNNNTKEIKGVYKYGTKWKVILSVDSKSKYFGSFNSEEEANNKRDLILKEMLQ